MRVFGCSEVIPPLTLLIIMKKTDLINGYQKGEMRLLTGYKFYTGVICTLGAAMMYNRAADLAHSFRYDVPSLDSRHIAFTVAASA